MSTALSSMLDQLVEPHKSAVLSEFRQFLSGDAGRLFNLAMTECRETAVEEAAASCIVSGEGARLAGAHSAGRAEGLTEVQDMLEDERFYLE